MNVQWTEQFMLKHAQYQAKGEGAAKFVSVQQIFKVG